MFLLYYARSSMLSASGVAGVLIRVFRGFHACFLVSFHELLYLNILFNFFVGYGRVASSRLDSL
jgi:hypothetical protein